MKLVQTLVVRDEGDVLDAHLAYQLNAGVDLVLAVGRGLEQRSAEILDLYEREGYVRLVREPPDAAEAELRTQLARLAASEHGADWIIPAHADEVWWPRGEGLKDVLAPIPPRYTVVQGLRRPFVARPDGDEFFADRMTVRQSLEAAHGGAAATLRPAHRADPAVVVEADGNVTLSRSVPLRAWYPIEVLHFPSRAPEDAGGEETAGSVVDTRLRDALRTLRQAVSEGGPGRAFARPDRGSSRLSFRTPDVVDDAAYAVECAAVGEVDLPRLEQYVAELEQRVAWLEQRLWPRLLRAASRLGRREAR